MNITATQFFSATMAALALSFGGSYFASKTGYAHGKKDAQDYYDCQNWNSIRAPKDNGYDIPDARCDALGVRVNIGGVAWVDGGKDKEPIQYDTSPMKVLTMREYREYNKKRGAEVKVRANP